jgi:hypothetical protein
LTKQKLVEKYFLRPAFLNKSFSGKRKRQKKTALKQIEKGISNLSLLDYAKNIAFWTRFLENRLEN